MSMSSTLHLFGRFFPNSKRVPSTPFFKKTSIFTPRTVNFNFNYIYKRNLSTLEEALNPERLKKIRNIGISAHIDSGKTTLTERILYYTGRIDEIHEVRGKDGVGAKMDSMDLEREKGITIQSAATYIQWRDTHINIIDTPGHVDFTIEVERSLRVLDAAILVICAVGSVQSQTMTVDRQMARYNVPRLCFINKLDRSGADPWRAINEMRQKLETTFAAVQVPIGLEDVFEGIIDLIQMKAVFYDGDKGNKVREEDIPEKFLDQAKEKQQELVMAVADVDDEFAEILMSKDEPPTPEELRAAIKRATIARKFTPVFMGSAYKNKGVQQLLDGVLSILPNPEEVTNTAIDVNTEEKISLTSDPKAPFVGYAFKLEEGKFGQLTYLRIYQGVLSRGGTIHNITTGERLKVPRLVRMHSNEMEEIYHIGSGEICALFGIDCHTGTTFTDGTVKYSMTAMFVPDAVMSLSVSLPKGKQDPNFQKALSKFEKEDPTFRVNFDAESAQTIISGMGELHLEIYIERMKREYGLNVIVGKPQVAFRETITRKIDFTYVHKKQSGGRGQYAKIIGYVEPITDHIDDFGGRTLVNEFVDETVGGSVPPEFVPSVEKGFQDALLKGPLVGHKICGLRFVLTDGAFHPVDSSDLAFRLAAKYACHQSIIQANPVVLEPIMKVEVISPSEFQSSIVGNLNRRKGVIMEANNGLQYYTVTTSVPLNNMFGYSTELRSTTQGKGEFSMEYLNHQICAREVQEQLATAYSKIKGTTEDKE